MCATQLCADIVPVHRHFYRQAEIFVPAEQIVTVNEYSGPAICPRPAVVKEGLCSSAGHPKPFFFRDSPTDLVGDVQPLTPQEYVNRYAGQRAHFVAAYPRVDMNGRTGWGMLIEI